MDSYGVVAIGGGLVSIPGLLFYAIVIYISVVLSTKLVDKVMSKPLRKVEYFTAGLSASVVATWLIINIGLWFYVAN